MDWPDVPVESIAPEAFRPPFCPRPGCLAHRDHPPAFQKHGFFSRLCDGRQVPRFLCTLCRKTCSLQTFACSYYLKRPELLVPVASQLNAGSGHRPIARTVECAPASVTALAARLGRHCLLLSASCLEQVKTIDEPVVVDHFESFAFSQEFPFGIATPVGHRSWFIYGLDPAPHRRGGRRTPAQLARLDRLKFPSRAGGYRASFRRCLDLLAPRLPAEGRLRLISDDHKSYGLALADHPQRQRFDHRVYPNPERGPKGSPRTGYARLRDGAFFPLDLLHALIRHSLAHHRRETIAYGRRLNAVLEQMFVFATWRNFVKRSSERSGIRTTPAMGLGLATQPWRWSRVFAKRLFPSRVPVPETWMQLYRREWITPAVGNNRRHELRRAF